MAYNIVVFGLGAIGSNMMVQLHKRYPDANFIGVDYDKVEDRNIKTQAYFQEHKGKPKAAVMPTVLARKDSIVKYTPVNKKITSRQDIADVILPLTMTNPTGKLIIIDAFDNTEARQLLRDFDFMNVVHVGFSPQYTAEIFWQEQYVVPGEIVGTFDICELDAAVFFIHLVVNFAALKISEYLDNDTKENFIILDKYKIRKV